MAEKLTALQNSYTDAECPDCGEHIPVKAVDGDECKNCGHVFHTESQEGEQV